MSTLLRLATAGSVDDGKSTLIGRLLYDAKALMADQVADAEIDLSRLTDGLRAEREQGITIDVAYRFFATPRRSFIIADTPGHVRYTRNMVTGASTADAAVVLIDARTGRDRAVAAAHLPVGAARHPPHRRVREQDGPRRLGRGPLPRDRAGLRGPADAAAGAGRWRDPGVGAARRLRGRAVGPCALVRRPDHAQLPRGPRGGGRPQPRRSAAAGAVGGARGRLPGLRRARRGRDPAAGRRGPRAPAGRAHDDRADRHLRRAGRGGVSPDVGHRGAGRRARRRSRQPDLRARRRADGGAPARRARVLDGGRAGPRGRALRAQAHDATGAGARRVARRATRSRDAVRRPQPGRAGAQRHRPAAPGPCDAGDGGAVHAQPRHRRLHPRSTRSRTRPSAPGWCWPRTRIRDRRAARTAPTSSGTSRRSRAASAGPCWRCAAPPCG